PSLLFRVLFFFFSSRRRHTRCLSDWSSDVCSSDLRALLRRACPSRQGRSTATGCAGGRPGWQRGGPPPAARSVGADRAAGAPPEIGRASCRGRVGGWVVGGV